MSRPTNGSDVVLDTEAWTAVLRDGRHVTITVNHHATRDTGQRWCYATAKWPGIESRLHLSGNTADRAVMRLVAAAINNGTDEDAVGVREVLRPGEMTRGEAVAAEREVCKALALRANGGVKGAEVKAFFAAEPENEYLVCHHDAAERWAGACRLIAWLIGERARRPETSPPADP